MDKQVLIFRKFLNEDTDQYVAVSSEDYSIGSHIDLRIHDGANLAYFTFSVSARDDTLDDSYAEAIKELEIIKTAVLAAMDELVDKYTEIKFSHLGDIEDRLYEIEEQEEEAPLPWETAEEYFNRKVQE